MEVTPCSYAETVFALLKKQEIKKESPLIEVFKEESLDNKGINETVSTPLTECITKLHRFSCILGLDEKVFEYCRIILTHVENKKYLERHTPLSRTSAVIFYVVEELGLKINKHKILKTCEISDVTINKCYQKIMKYKEDLEFIKINV